MGVKILSANHLEPWQVGAPEDRLVSIVPVLLLEIWWRWCLVHLAVVFHRSFQFHLDGCGYLDKIICNYEDKIKISNIKQLAHVIAG